MTNTTTMLICRDDFKTFTAASAGTVDMVEHPDGEPCAAVAKLDGMAFSSVGDIVEALAGHRPRVSPLDTLAQGREQIKSDATDEMILELFM